MKYVIEIFENGIRSDVFVTNDEYDYDGYSKVYSDKAVTDIPLTSLLGLIRMDYI